MVAIGVDGRAIELKIGRSSSSKMGKVEIMWIHLKQEVVEPK